MTDIKKWAVRRSVILILTLKLTELVILQPFPPAPWTLETLTTVSALKPSYAALSLAPGYKAQLIFTDSNKPRGITVDDQGHLLVVQQGVGVSSLTIEATNGCLKVTQNVSVVENANLAHGITISGDGKTLYASSTEASFSWPYDAAKSTADSTGSDIIAISNTSDSDHIPRTLLYSGIQ
ncbi:MAG: hypothetical protein M1812_003616 [Candelaria pacifica]|nr:MAG: hypothetical protein M1812_003616 [Candelaria pacifica]